MPHWLLIDCPNVMHRALHTTGPLSHKGVVVGTVYGFLRTLLTLQSMFNTDDVAFMFDQGAPLRLKEFPDYKKERRDKVLSLTDEECITKSEYMRQETLLKDKILPKLGYKNIFSHEGYEADDLIAQACKTLPFGHSGVVVSSDKDLYQLLDGSRVTIWRMGGNSTYTQFNLADDYYGVSPKEWAVVKGIAGCKSDGVAGVQGVGEITASKYLTGRLKERSRTAMKITKDKPIWRKNLPLVTLPYTNTPEVDLEEGGEFDIKAWRELIQEMGFQSLLKLPKMHGDLFTRTKK